MATNKIFEALAKAEKQRALTSNQNTAGSLAISDAMETISGAGEEALEAVSSYEDAALVITAEKDSMAARTDAANARAKFDLGIDSEKSNYRLTKLAADGRSAYENAVAAEDIIHEKKSRTFLSDPLGFINAQLTVPSDIDVYNHFARRHNMAEEEYNGIVNSGTATAKMNEAIKMTTSAATAAANLDLVSTKAQQDRVALTKEYAQQNIQGQLALQSMSDKALSHEESAVRLLESAENFKLRQQQMALNSAQRSETLKRTQLLNEQLETTMEGRAQIKMEQDAQTEAYNAGVRAIGGRELSTPQVLEKLKNDKTGYQGNFVRYGQDILANGGSKAGIPVLGMGMTAADMMGMVRASSARPTGIDRDVYEFGATETNKAIETLKNALDKDPVKRALQIKEEIYKSASAQLASIDNSTGATNIYSAPTPKQLSEAVPVLNKYPKLQEIIKRSTDNPNVPIKDMDIFEAMKTELQTNPTKENFAEIATSINHYYSAVREYNNTHKGYLEKGLPQQKTYNVALPTGLFGGKQDIDMTDPLQVKRLLIKMSLNMQSSFAPN